MRAIFSLFWGVGMGRGWRGYRKSPKDFMRKGIRARAGTQERAPTSTHCKWLPKLKLYAVWAACQGSRIFSNSPGWVDELCL